MLDLFSYGFMLRALLAGLIVGTIAPIIGSFLVIRRQSLFADTLSHIALLGVAVGLYTNTFPLFTAVLISVLGAILIGVLYLNKNIVSDALLGLFLYGSLGLAIVLAGLARGTSANMMSFLFGSIVTVSSTDLYVTLGLGAIVLALVYFCYKELFFLSFDEEVARVSGIKVEFLTILLLAVAAAAVSISIRVVGSLLIGALMVIPVITAIQFGKNFTHTILLAVALSLLSVFLGLLLSYYLNIASGGTIVLVSLAFFIVTHIFRKG